MTATTVRPAQDRRRLPHLHGLTWVTWRQHRMALAGIVVLLGGTAVLLVLTGLPMHRAYTKLGLAACGDISSSACVEPFRIFSSGYQGWAMFLPRFLMFLPAAVGVFVGAPLVAREFESGTFRFAWTQGRSRVQWIAAKLALLGVALSALALAFSFLFAWWFGPWESIMGRMISGQAYEVLGIVFAARTLFAFTLGVLLGAVLRRTVPAMAATAAIWLAVVWPSVVYLRPLIVKPLIAPDSASIGLDKAWAISAWIQDGAGRHLSTDAVTGLLNRARATGVSTPAQFDAWLAKRHYTQWVSYQPNNRFWHFQLIEAGSLVVLALVLAAASVWWLRRRAR